MAFALPGRALLVLAVLDCCVTGLWLLARPADLLALLEAGPNADARLLLRALGALLLGQGACVALAVRHSKELLVAPLLGRALQVGLALWLLASEQAGLAPGPLRAVLAHDLVVLALLGVLALWRE